MPGRGWRVLAAAVGFVATLIAAPATGLGAQTTGDCVAAASWPAARADLAAAAVTAVNAHRVSLGLAPLAPSAALTSSAEWKARHMAAYGYMAHDDPAPPLARSLWERIAACGYGGPAGENVARWYPTGAAAVAA